MPNYSHKENDAILDKWNKRSIEKSMGEIESDGVAYKGSIKTFSGDDGQVYHERMAGNEEKIWNESPRRILFIAKELNDPNNPYDSRVVVRYDEQNGIYSTDKFIKNMLFINHGLQKMNGENYEALDREISMDELMKVWDESAVAKINVKKQPGGSTANMYEISEAIVLFEDLLKAQLSLLDANIIVCCDGSGILIDRIKNLLYSDAIQINDYVWYSPHSGVCLINSYHLKPRNKTYEEVYERVVKSFSDSLKDMPAIN